MPKPQRQSLRENQVHDALPSSAHPIFQCPGRWTVSVIIPPPVSGVWFLSGSGSRFRSRSRSRFRNPAAGILHFRMEW